MNKHLLLQSMDREKVSRKQMALKLGIAYNTLNLKINGKKIFSIPEVNKIKSILNLSVDEWLNIFFNENVA